MSNRDYQTFSHFFSPKSVAVIGASNKPGTVGRAIMENLLERFKGTIYPVNLKYEEVLGVKCFKSCKELPSPPQLAVIAVPARVVPSVIEECGAIGVKAAIIISAGFKETGPEGAALEEELVKTARKWGMRIIGPNCLGIYDAHSGLDTIFNPSDRQGKPSPGSVALISQSGALGAAILDWFAEAGIGMSKFISYGNAADVKEWEIIEFLVKDPDTRVIVAYIEGVEDGRNFLNSIRESVKANKPVVILKAGKSEKGMKAVSSHTGSLAGSYAVYEAAIKQAGGIIVSELNEVLIATKALTWLPPPGGRRVAIVTNGGGAGVLATDAIELQGLLMAELAGETKSTLRAELPKAASVNNPVDILGDAPPERYRAALEAVLKDPGVDSVIVIGIMQSPAYDPAGVLKILKELVPRYGKPVVVSSPGGAYTLHHLENLEKNAKIPAFKTPEEAVKALRYLTEWGIVRKRLSSNASLQ